MKQRPEVNGHGEPCTHALATFACEGSMAQPHVPLFFTAEEADKGCPYGCECPPVNKNHGVGMRSF